MIEAGKCHWILCINNHHSDGGQRTEDRGYDKLRKRNGQDGEWWRKIKKNRIRADDNRANSLQRAQNDWKISNFHYNKMKLMCSQYSVFKQCMNFHLLMEHFQNDDMLSLTINAVPYYIDGLPYLVSWIDLIFHTVHLHTIQFPTEMFNVFLTWNKRIYLYVVCVFTWYY